MERARHLAATIPGGALMMGLFLFHVSCSSSDGGGQVTPLSGAEGAEAAAKVSQAGLLGVEEILDFEVPEVGGAGAATLEGQSRTLLSRVLPRLRFQDFVRLNIDKTPRPGEAQVESDCDGGGTLVVGCDVVGNRSILTLVASECVQGLFGFEIETEGGFEVEIDDPEACADETGVETLDDATLEFNALEISTRFGGEILSRIYADGTITTRDRVAAGCEGESGILEASFTLDIQSGEGEEVEDLLIVAQNLVAEVTAASDPCRETVVLNGVLDSNDRSRKERVRLEFQDFTLAVTEGVDEQEVTVDGEFTTSCLGAVRLATLEPLLRPLGDEKSSESFGDGECATGGRLEVTLLESQESSWISYTETGGVEIDLGRDGSTDLSYADCADLPSDPSCGQ